MDEAQHVQLNWTINEQEEQLQESWYQAPDNERIYQYKLKIVIINKRIKPKNERKFL